MYKRQGPFYGRRGTGGSFFGTTTTTYTSVEQPIMITSTGTRYFRLVNEMGAPLNMQAYIFTAFETADTPDAANIPTLAQRIPAVTEGTPPVLSLMSQVRTYDVNTDSFDPSGAAQVIDIMLLGNQEGTDRRRNVARAIRDGLNATSTFTAEIISDPNEPSSPNTRVMVTTTANEKRTLDHSVAHNVVAANNFTIAPTQEGVYNYGPGLGQLPPIGPTYTVTGPEGFMPTEVTVLITVDINISAEAMLAMLADPIQRFDGWTRTDTLADGEITLETVNRDAAMGFTPNSMFTEMTVHLQDDLAQRAVASAWTFTRVRQGNVEGASTCLLYTSPSPRD